MGNFQKYNTTIHEIVNINNIQNPNLIYPGQTFIIITNTDFCVIGEPNKIIYKIQRGDTLSEIAQKFNTTVQRLVEENDISNPNLIYTGNYLIID